MGIDALVTLGGLIIPPAFDFIKKKFLKPSQDTPEATMNALATSKPETLAPYVDAMSNYIKAQVAWYNRDVIGTDLWEFTINLRALIRPCAVVIFGMHLILAKEGFLAPMDEGLRWFYEGIISSWFGSKLNKE